MEVGSYAKAHPRLEAPILKHLGLEPDKRYKIVGFDPLKGTDFVGIVLNVDGKEKSYDPHWLAAV